MRNLLLSACLLAGPAALAATMASQPWVTNRIAEAVAAIPQPGNYATVSNRAMSALQSHQSLQPSTNYTDAALAVFASTGAVARANVYGTPNRWVDATGCVWEVGAPEWKSTTEGVEFHEWTEITHGDYAGMWDLYFSAYGDGSHVYTNAPSLHQSITVPAGAWWYHNDMEDRGAFPVAFVLASITNLVGRVALTNEIPDVSGYTTPQQVTNAAIAVADAKISTNNAAFVEAVTNCPVVIASGGGGGDGFPAGDWSDYGTLGALLAAIIAAITWLKNNQRYALHTVTLTNGAGTLLDRAVNAVSVSGDTTLTLPALVNAGKARDLLVRLEISGSTVPTITFAAPTGETITYETDGDEFPVPDEAGTWLYSFTETAAHTFAVALKSVSVVTQGGV